MRGLRDIDRAIVNARSQGCKPVATKPAEKPALRLPIFAARSVADLANGRPHAGLRPRRHRSARAGPALASRLRLRLDQEERCARPRFRDLRFLRVTGPALLARRDALTCQPDPCPPSRCDGRRRTCARHEELFRVAKRLLNSARGRVRGKHAPCSYGARSRSAASSIRARDRERRAEVAPPSTAHDQSAADLFRARRGGDCKWRERVGRRRPRDTDKGDSRRGRDRAPCCQPGRWPARHREACSRTAMTSRRRSRQSSPRSGRTRSRARSAPGTSPQRRVTTKAARGSLRSRSPSFTSTNVPLSSSKTPLLRAASA